MRRSSDVVPAEQRRVVKPDEIDAFLRRELEQVLGRPGPLRWSARPVERGAIWNFCEAVEDANPVYWDEERAAASRFGGLIAPPQALMSLMMDGWWLPTYLRRDDEVTPPLHPEATAAAHRAGLGAAANVLRDEEYLLPLGPGDGRIGQVDTLTEISAVKQTALGLGVFLTTHSDYRRERDGRQVARSVNVLLMYDARRPRA